MGHEGLPHSIFVVIRLFHLTFNSNLTENINLPRLSISWNGMSSIISTIGHSIWWNNLVLTTQWYYLSTACMYNIVKMRILHLFSERLPCLPHWYAVQIGCKLHLYHKWNLLIRMPLHGPLHQPEPEPKYCIMHLHHFNQHQGVQIGCHLHLYRPLWRCNLPHCLEWDLHWGG